MLVISETERTQLDASDIDFVDVVMNGITNIGRGVQSV